MAALKLEHQYSMSESNLFPQWVLAAIDMSDELRPAGRVSSDAQLTSIR